MDVRAALRHGALFGVVVCQAIQAARASRTATKRITIPLVAPGPWQDNTEDNYCCENCEALSGQEQQQAELEQRIAALHRSLEVDFCNATVSRPGSGEVVTCVLTPGHDGKWHVGAASDVDEYTWPNEAYVQQDDECSCTGNLLQSDLVQTAIDWRWRIYDRDCDDQLRLFAEGSSDDLDAAREDVVATMRLLAENSNVVMSDPVHTVEHHITAQIAEPS